MATFDEVKKIIVEKLGAKPEDVTEDKEFIRDLGADSLDVVEFVMEVEKQFDITIPDEDAGKITKVGDAVKYIDEHKKN